MINQGTSESRVETVDIKEYIAILLKRKWLILICFLLALAGTTAFLFTRQPVWRATGKLLVTQWGGSVPVSDVTREDERSFYETQISIMYSSALQQRVRERVNRSPEDIRDNLRAFSIGRSGGSALMNVSVDSPSREFAKDYANAIAEEFMKFRDEQRAQGSETALLMLTREINRLSQEMKSANQRVTDYLKDHHLAGVAQLKQEQFDLVLHSLSGAAMSLADAQMRRQLIEAKPDATSALAALGLGSAITTTPATSRPEISTDLEGRTQTNASALAASLYPRDAISDAAAQASAAGRPTISGDTLWATSYHQAERLFAKDLRRRSLETRLQDLMKTYKPKHPAVLDVEEQLKEVRLQIDAEVEMIRDQTAAEIKLAQAKFDRVKAQYDKINEQILQDNAQMIELQALRDDHARIQGLYNMLLGQLMKVDMSQNFGERTISILEPAIVQRDPVYPQKAKGLFTAAFLGLGLGLALAFFIEYIDDSIKLAEDVERELQLPFLGMIPAAQWNPDDMSAHRLDRLKQQGGVAEAYRVVRSALLFATPREKLHTILFTSAVPREGKTTTCVNLSIAFSQVEDNVLLVDGDLRRGEVHRYFNVDREKGLADILLGEATPEEVIRRTDVPKLDIITSGAYPTNPAELLLGWRLKEFLDWAQKHYARVIIDCTPVMGIADSAILGSAVDGVVFVIWAGRTSRRYVRVAKMTAVSRGAKIFGFMLNNLEPGRVGYYHYYPYYYSYYSRGYYYARKEEPSVPVTTPAGTAPSTNGEPAPQQNDDDKIDDVY